MKIALMTIIPTRTALVWYPAEALDAETLDDVHRLLVEDGVLRIEKFETTRLADGAFLVRERIPKIIGRAGVVEITAFDAKIIETQPAP